MAGFSHLKAQVLAVLLQEPSQGTCAGEERCLVQRGAKLHPCELTLDPPANVSSILSPLSFNYAQELKEIH